MEKREGERERERVIERLRETRVLFSKKYSPNDEYVNKDSCLCVCVCVCAVTRIASNVQKVEKRRMMKQEDGGMGLSSVFFL